MNPVLFVVVIVAAVLLGILILFRVAWRVAEPDEALIISGFRSNERPEGVGESMGFRIVTGRGCLVVPSLTKVRKLSLEAHESQIIVPCVSKQKIVLSLAGTCLVAAPLIWWCRRRSRLPLLAFRRDRAPFGAAPEGTDRG